MRSSSGRANSLLPLASNNPEIPHTARSSPIKASAYFAAKNLLPADPEIFESEPAQFAWVVLVASVEDHRPLHRFLHYRIVGVSERLPLRDQGKTIDVDQCVVLMGGQNKM